MNRHSCTTAMLNLAMQDMTQNSKMGAFSIVRATLGVYHYNGECLHPRYRRNVDFTATDHKALDKHHRNIFYVSQAFDKIQKYPIYFEHFYPCNEENISIYEALEHHVHSYLEDTYGLREKICKEYLDNLKKDCNADDDKKRISEIEKHVIEYFNSICEKRRRHAHHGPRHIDHDIADAAAMAQMLDDPFMRGQLTPYGVTMIASRKGVSLQKAKSKWVNLVKINSLENMTLLDRIFENTASMLFKVVNIKPLPWMNWLPPDSDACMWPPKQ